MKNFVAMIAIALGLALGGVALERALAHPTPSEQATPLAKNEIRIVEHPGYFETTGSVFQIAPGTYTFRITNRAGKDAGFVLTREGRPPVVLPVAEGETKSLEVALESGSYTYSCPLIPTPPYPLLVK